MKCISFILKTGRFISEQGIIKFGAFEPKAIFRFN